MSEIKNIHHIGRVVDSISRELENYKELGFEIDKDVVIDKEQKVRVGKVKIQGKIVIELLEPLDETSPIWKFSKEKKGGYHHICIEVLNIKSYIKYIKDNNLGFRLTKTTTSVFDERKVCFISTNGRDIIELIE